MIPQSGQTFVKRIFLYSRLHTLSAVFTLCSLFFAVKGDAQTPLAQGDIAFVAYNSDGSVDDFAFMLLKDITTGTTITFTDHLWQYSTGGFYENTSFGACNTETFMTWTASSALTVGTVVVISNPGATGSTNPSQATASTGTLFVPGSCPDFSFPPSGDVLFAYQGTKPASNSANNWLACINMDGGWISATSTSTSASAKPTNLSNDNIILLTPEVDNAVYKGTLTGTATQLKAAIYDLANWDTDDATPFTLPQDIGSSAMPVSWGAFSATSTATGVELRWSTHSEANTSHFETEFSTDGKRFTTDSRIPAAGNSTTETHYQALIPHQKFTAPSTHYFFRIKQVDTDGQFDYSTTKKLAIATQEKRLLSTVQRSPGNEVLLQLSRPGLLITVFDVQGRKLVEQRALSTSITVNTNAVAGSILVLHVSDGQGKKEVHKVAIK
ncbi:MAG: hypothetical protein ACO1NW_05350 [Chitinophagaceae bacterium]